MALKIVGCYEDSTACMISNSKHEQFAQEVFQFVSIHTGFLTFDTKLIKFLTYFSEYFKLHMKSGLEKIDRCIYTLHMPVET